MILKKRYKRDIKQNRSLYISTILLTILSLLLFYLYYIAGTGIQDYGEKVFASQRIEDAHFSTYLDIPDEKINELEEQFDLELEKQEYINIDTDGVVSRVFEATDKIDLYKVTEGNDVKKDHDLIISKGFADNEGLVIGDTIKIKNQDYTITGFVERPDYLYMLQNVNDTDKNINSFYICYMTEDDFASLGDANTQYLVRYQKDNSKEFRKAIHDEYIMNAYYAASENPRILMVNEQAELFIVMSYFILFSVPLIAVVFISIILSRKIKNEQKMIGTLATYGYTKMQIIKHYAGFAGIPGIVGGILTTIVIWLFADDYGALGLMDYEPIHATFTLGIPQMLMGIFIPTLMYVISSSWTVHRLLKNDITTLLAGNAGGKNKTKKYLVGKSCSFRLKFSVRSLLGNLGRTFVLFLGVLLGSLVIFFALGDYDSIMNIIDDTKSQMENYQYQYVLNELNEENPYDAETLLAASVEDQDGRTLSLFGADDNSLLGLKDMSQHEVTVDDSYMISSLYATLMDLEIGDKITVSNPLSLKSYTIEISNIIDDNFSKSIYTSRKNVSKMTGIDKNQYNILLSIDELEIPEHKINTLISKDSVEEQHRVVFQQMNVLIFLFVGIGVFLCIVAVYIGVNMVIVENRSTISMLQVLGYNEKRIHDLLLKNNIVVVLLAMLVGFPCAAMIGKMMFVSFIDVLGYMIDWYVKPSSYLLSIGLVLISYSVSVYFVSKKIHKIDMVESLKDNRE